MSDKIYQSALILGLASSGEAAARLLLAGDAQVQIVDENKNDEILRRVEPLERLGAKIAAGGRSIPDGDYDVCVVSPGLKPGSPLLNEVRTRGIPVLSEFEFGWMRAKCPVVAVTGSNGKSTLVKLCVETLQRAGLKAFASGNYGPPVSRVVLEHPEADWLVIEVSSFQLETVREFRPDVGVLLNVFPNHLDRHGDLGSYAGIKARLFAKMQSGDKVVINEDNLSSLTGKLPGDVRPVTFGFSKGADYLFSDNFVTAKASGRIIDFSGTYFANDALGLTAAAAAAVMDSCRVAFNHLEDSARVFQALPHRMELIGSRNNVKFVDDSKATNLAALLAALKTVPGNVRLIAGGLSKNETYAPARPLLAEKARGIYLIGRAAAEMAAAWQNIVPCHFCGTLEKAVAEAWRHSVPGDTILLSPACASFDQFRNFEERGNRFRQLFESLGHFCPESG